MNAETKEKSVKKPRPYWHVDMKWIGGIGFFFALSATLLLYNLSALTERDRAVNISATVVAGLFSRQGLDDESGLAELRAKAALLPGDTVAPIPQFPFVTITKQELQTMSARDLRVKIFSQITGPIYDKGLSGAAASFTPNPDEQKKFEKDATLLGVFTKTTHEVLQGAFVIALIVTFVAAAEMIFFSAGWGRLVSPGLVLLLVSPVGAIISLMLLHPPMNGDAPLAQVPSGVAQQIGDIMARSYLFTAILGVALLVIALIGKITVTILRRRQAAK
jgi:hypothetical protein